jgi:hypothetical protein
MQHNTPKNFIIQLGALIALYASITSLLVLLFGVINLQFPDEAAYYYENESARDSIRTAMAVLIVFFPTYLVLTRLSNESRRKEQGGEYTTITRWLIYVSLLVFALILLADLVTLINYFLNGEITTRFLYKVFALFFVVGAAFHYYLLDVRGYFIKHIDTSFMFAIGATIVVFGALVFGYTHIEAPSEVREMRFDEQQVTDLQNAQSYIENFYLQNDTLPATFEAAFGSLPAPAAPTGRAPYTYTVASDTSYRLCATFSAPTTDINESYPAFMEKNYDWTHQAGDWCFERVIVPVAADVKPLM